MDKESLYFYYTITICTVAALAILFVRSSLPDPLTDVQRKEYIESLGWHVIGERVETSDFTVPNEFDNIYEDYNMLQKRAGFDLTPFKGKKVTRYTYIISNYPVDTTDQVRVNLIEFSGRIIGGDIMTTNLHGFMHPLMKNVQ